MLSRSRRRTERSGEERWKGERQGRRTQEGREKDSGGVIVSEYIWRELVYGERQMVNECSE